MQNILQNLLQWLAHAYIQRYQPHIVAITGNVGKTSTKEAIAEVLSRHARTRASGGNLNNELGVPLTILGDYAGEYYEGGGGIFFWSKVLIRGFWGLLVPSRYPEILVLEYGADRPGDIGNLSRLYKPHVAVVTAVGEIPVHVEYFASPEALAHEKSKLVRALEPGDLAVLNFDDQAVVGMREHTKAIIKTFGFQEGADVRIANLETTVDETGTPDGVTFKLEYNRGFVPVKIQGSLGTSQAYAAAAAALVGLHLGMNLVDVIEALSHFKGVPGRLRILRGLKNSIIIDDTYNAAPAAMHVALDTLASLPAQRKVAVLGDMLELGKYSLEAHQAVGNRVGEIVQILVCVGEKAKFIAEAARNQLPEGSIYTFHTSSEAAPKVQEILQEGDLVLVKGSQGKRMEKVVEEIMANPERKTKLLVRQSGKWRSH